MPQSYVSEPMPDLHFFFDETGSTGPNFLDPAQPCYALVGIGVHPENLAACRELVDELRTSTGAAELYGVGRMDDRTWRTAAAGLARGLYDCGAIILVVLVEKRYALAGWFVNIFLDADAEGNERPEFNRDGDRQREVANLIAGLPLEALRPTYAATREPTEENQRAARDAVVHALREAGHHDLADTIEASRLPSGVLEGEGDELRMMRMGRSPNTTGYMTALALVQRLAESVGAETVAFVHDETASFEEVYNHHFEMAADPESYARMRPWLEAHGFPLLDRIDPTFAVSTDDLMVQAADLIAAGLGFIAKRVAERGPSDDSVLKLYALLFQSLTPMDERFTTKWYVISDAFAARAGQLGAALVRAQARREQAGPPAR